MIKKNIEKIKGVCLVSLVALSLLVGVMSHPSTARAQGTVPQNSTFDFHAIMDNLKSFTLDRLATLMAKQILHQMTASVINWINSGFHGSPSFLTNPAGFFLDAADQFTGIFLSNGGPLSRLCSPFNLDLRLALSLNLSLPSTDFSSKRYACTLGSVIQSAKNGSLLTVNGKSITGFMKGDFSQGGWPAFISLTSDVENNPYDSYLSADSEIHAQIMGKKVDYNKDLLQGNGFLSYQDCQDIPGGTVDASDPDQVDQAEAIVGGDTSINRKANKDGTITYQSCKTQTPGSVISSQLQKQLNVPADELELANDINSVINALMSQMISQMLSKGLGALSGGSGGNASYTSQIISDTTSSNSANTLQSRHDAANNVIQNMEAISSSITLYDQATSTVAASAAVYETAKACFITKIKTVDPTSKAYTYGQSQIIEISAALTSDAYPLIVTLQAKRQDLVNALAQLTQTSADISGITASSSTLNSTDQINSQTRNLDTYISNLESGVKGTTDKNTAAKDLNDAKAQAKTFTADALKYQKSCDSFPPLYY